MASGKTEEMILFTRSLEWYPKPEKVQKERDRSLRGKARAKARKAARRG
jgi:hypothetical protein